MHTDMTALIATSLPHSIPPGPILLNLNIDWIDLTYYFITVHNISYVEHVKINIFIKELPVNYSFH